MTKVDLFRGTTEDEGNQTGPTGETDRVSTEGP